MSFLLFGDVWEVWWGHVWRTGGQVWGTCFGGVWNLFWNAFGTLWEDFWRDLEGSMGMLVNIVQDIF